jgi:outer membrane receptor protein involved in Fe transport
MASRLENRLRADTAGVEIAARVTPVPAWRLDGSYSTFRLTARPDAGSQDVTAATADGSAPSRQWQMHSSVRINPRVDVDASLFHASALRKLAVPAYTRADARVEVRLSRRLSAIAVGSNLFNATHLESGSSTIVITRVPRSANIQLVWRLEK